MLQESVEPRGAGLVVRWSDVDPRRFEELIYRVLVQEGFFDVSWLGVSGNDQGRDIVCKRMNLFGPSVVLEHFVFQCKRYTKGIDRATILDDLVKCSQHRLDFFVLATCADLSAGAKEWLQGVGQKFSFRVVLWERVDLEVLLDKHQELRQRFFGIPCALDFKLDHFLISSGVGKGSACPSISSCAARIIGSAFDRSLASQRMLTASHLLSAVLDVEDPVRDAILLEHRGVALDEIVVGVREFAEGQAEVVEGPLLSESVKEIVRVASSLAFYCNHSILDLRILALALFGSGRSISLDFFCRILGVPVEGVADRLLAVLFSPEKQILLSLHLKRLGAGTNEVPQLTVS